MLLSLFLLLYWAFGKNEKFTDGGDSTGNLGLFQVSPTIVFNEQDRIVDYIFLSIDVAVWVVSIFFYFRRNRQRFDVRNFLAALLLAYFYIAYALAVPLHPE
jgi:hypothetical protein